MSQDNARESCPENGSGLGPAGWFAGDIFVASTDVDDSNVDLRNHRGPGRILHYDSAFNLKGAVYTGDEGLVVGIALDPAHKVLYAADPLNQAISRFDAADQKLGALAVIPAARFGSVAFDFEGRLMLGVHSKHGEDPNNPAPKFYRVSPDSDSCQAFNVDIDGGKLGFHAVTHFDLAPDGRTLYYVSENGRRVMRYDLQNDRQLTDFKIFGDDDPIGTCGLIALEDGGIVMATGRGAVRMDESGEIIFRYDIEELRGWARVEHALEPGCFHISNFFEGIVERRRIDTGELVLSHNIGRKFSLCGLAEFAG